MLPVYCQHFGLKREPFSISPDPSFLYMGDSHEEALAQLVYGIKTRRGFAVLTGEVGTGKTTLIHRLMDELNGSVKTAYVFNMITSAKDLLRYVCEKFGIIDSLESREDVHDYLSLFERFLFRSQENGDNVALIIDEAQNLTTEVLENIRLLSNFETPRAKLLQILLVGQPELAVRLNTPELRQIKQRVALRHHLSNLDSAECTKYISTRLEIAGASVSLFASDALAAVYDYSNGIPRIINILCDNGLLAAYASRQPMVDGKMIREISRSLNFTAFAGRNRSDFKDSVISSPTPAPSKPREFDVQLSAPMLASPRIQPASQQIVNGEPLHRTVVRGDIPEVKCRTFAPFPKKDLERDGIFVVGESKVVPVPARLFDEMIRALTDAMGPMAPLVVREHVAAMGESEKTFPKKRLPQLVDRTSQEILVETSRIEFQRFMEEEIRRIDLPSGEITETGQAISRS